MPDFNWRDQAACKGEPADIFFPTSKKFQGLTNARQICRECPVFESCMDWSLRNFPKIEHGIFFGYGESDRLRMWMGIMKPRDWRQDKHVVRTDPMSVSGYERRALASGVPAVVNAHQIYGVSTFLERQKIVQEYQAWRDEQMIPAVVSEAESRAAMMAKRAKSVAEKPRARRLSPEDRPQCPNGHGGVPMHRVQKTGAFQRWSCYKCMAKVLVDEAIGDRLNG